MIRRTILRTRMRSRLEFSGAKSYKRFDSNYAIKRQWNNSKDIFERIFLQFSLTREEIVEIISWKMAKWENWGRKKFSAKESGVATFHWNVSHWKIDRKSITTSWNYNCCYDITKLKQYKIQNKTRTKMIRRTILRSRLEFSGAKSYKRFDSNLIQSNVSETISKISSSVFSCSFLSREKKLWK